MLGETGVIVLRIIMGSGLIVIGIMSARRLYSEQDENDKKGFKAHIKKFFVSYFMIMIGLYILFKGF